MRALARAHKEHKEVPPTAQMDAAAAAPCIPIVYGSIAFWLGKPAAGTASQDHTHRWMVFLRHADDKDMSYAISKVVFTLHPSFTNPVRGTFVGAPY